MAGLFKSPKSPTAQPLPQVPNVKEDPAAAARAQREAEAERLKAAKGAASTILTSPLGVGGTPSTTANILS